MVDITTRAAKGEPLTFDEVDSNFTNLKAGVDGLDGQGVPTGGATGQVLAKVSTDDFDTTWVDQGSASVPWDDVTDKPTSFPPSAHEHVIGDVSGLQSALDGKQDTLVSGANIKTVNGESLLGGGDLEVSGGVSGPLSSSDGELAAFDGTTGQVLQSSGVTAAEIITARGDRSQLGQRISTISNFTSPNAGGILVGRYYDNSLHALNAVTSGSAANRVQMTSFHTAKRLRIDQIGIAVTTAQASSLARCFIYGTGSNNWPDELLFEGGSNLDCSSTGYKSHSLDFTFDSGRQYWLGVRTTGTQTLRGVTGNGSVNFGLPTGTSNTYYNTIRRTLAFATPLPANWGLLVSDLISGASPYSIRMRAAAI